MVGERSEFPENTLIACVIILLGILAAIPILVLFIKFCIVYLIYYRVTNYSLAPLSNGR
jgi:hypothetical protein